MSIENKRKFEMFLNEQSVREAKKMEKISKHKDKLDEQNDRQLLFQPKISKASNELVHSTRRSSIGIKIHDRLYEDSKKYKLKEHNKQQKLSSQTQPRPIDDKLYQDAKFRNIRKEQLRKKINMLEAQKDSKIIKNDKEKTEFPLERLLKPKTETIQSLNI